MVFLQEGNHLSPCVERRQGRLHGPWSASPGVTCLSTGGSLMTSCQVTTLKHPDHSETRTEIRKLSWLSDTNDSPRLQSESLEGSFAACATE